MATATKRNHSPSRHSTKKIKQDPEIVMEEMNDVDEDDLARLRCFGVDSDALTAAAVSTISPAIEKEKKTSKRNHLTSQEEKELRRERGDLLLKLFREVPWLADSASARRAEKNQERAQMWEVITEKVNNSFGDRLEYLSVDKVKKLLTYYKKKDDGSYDNIKNSLPLDDDQETTEASSTVLSESRSESGDDDTSAKGVVLIEEKEDGNQQLMEFLAAMGATAEIGNKSKTEEKPHTVANAESLYQLKKDRHDFVVQQAEHYMERMCFDNSSRSAAVNAERHCMWIKITHKANERFAEALGPLGVEQAKKLYSNCKRRRRVKAEMGAKGGDDNRGDSATPDENNDHSSLMDEDFETPAATNFEELIRGLDRSVEIDELRRQVRDKDAEIERLKKKVAEQATEYSARVKAMVELLKVAVDKKVSDDIHSYLS